MIGIAPLKPARLDYFKYASMHLQRFVSSLRHNVKQVCKMKIHGNCEHLNCQCENRTDSNGKVTGLGPCGILWLHSTGTWKARLNELLPAK